MPRKRKLKNETVTVVVNGAPIAVSLYPPSGARRSWYAYWNGLEYARSTGQIDFHDAVNVVEGMLRNAGKRPCLSDTLPSDEEFEEIQRQHYGKKTGSDAQQRSETSLRECLDAIAAFRKISGLVPVTKATPEDCERFQRAAVNLLKNWRVRYSERTAKLRQDSNDVEKLSPNTVVKWSVALQAAFERANRNGGKKCVRGIVPDARLLTDNPWRHFTWIEGFDRPIRQFNNSELLSLLDYLDSEWPCVAVAPAYCKVMFWAWARRQEVSRLSWADERTVGQECHFRSKGKWGRTKWFRIPRLLRAELERLKTGSDFVFGAYPEQLRAFHLGRGGRFGAGRVRPDFVPENFGEWMYHRVRTWSSTLPNGSAFLHVFRKTSLQHAVNGEHTEQRVADDAAVTAAVMRASYTEDTDENLRLSSNRTFRRIRRSLSVEVAARYGHEEGPADRVSERLDLARQQGDWAVVAELAQQLAHLVPGSEAIGENGR